MNLHLPENDDLKEIVFENRNKAYGAYRLRTDYHRTLNRSMGISLLAVSLFAGLVFILHKVTRNTQVPDVSRTQVHIIRQIELETQVKGEIKTSAVQGVKHEIAPTLPKPLERNFDVVDEVKPTEQLTASTATPTLPAAGNETGPSASVTPGTLPTGTMLPESAIPAVPFEMAAVDVAPVFPGGMDKFYKYLHDKLVFTSAAREARLSERMYVNFVLGKDGKITTIQILRRVGYGMDEIVESVLAKSPAWSPGMVHGQPVSTYIRLPISFEALQ